MKEKGEEEKKEELSYEENLRKIENEQRDRQKEIIIILPGLGRAVIVSCAS